MSDITDVADLHYGSAERPATPVWKLSWSISSTATTIIVNFEPLDEDWASITKNFHIAVLKSTWFVEVMYVTNVASTTLTVVRWIDIAWLDISTGWTDFATSHDDQSTIVMWITAVAFNMLAQALRAWIWANIKFNARPTWDVTASNVAQSMPVYADVATWEAAIASPVHWDRFYATSEWKERKYINGAWVDATSWATLNATATVPWKVELATSAQSKAWTDSETWPLSVLPSDIAANAQSWTFVYTTVADWWTDVFAWNLTPAITAYTEWAIYRLKFDSANTTTAPTVNLNTVWALTITSEFWMALNQWDIRINENIELMYDWTWLRMLRTSLADIDSFWWDWSDWAISWALTLTWSDNTVISKQYTNFIPWANSVTVTPIWCIVYIRVNWTCDLTGTTFDFTWKWQTWWAWAPPWVSWVWTDWVATTELFTTLSGGGEGWWNYPTGWWWGWWASCATSWANWINNTAGEWEWWTRWVYFSQAYSYIAWWRLTIWAWAWWWGWAAWDASWEWWNWWAWAWALVIEARNWFVFSSTTFNVAWVVWEAQQAAQAWWGWWGWWGALILKYKGSNTWSPTTNIAWWAWWAWYAWRNWWAWWAWIYALINCN